MSSGGTIVDVLKDAFVPQWIYDWLFASAKPRPLDSNALEAFRQRIDLQQVN